MAGSASLAQGFDLSGSASGGVTYDSDAVGGTLEAYQDFDFVISATGQSQTGLDFGAFIDLNEDGVDDSEVFLTGDLGRITIGEVSAATDGFGISDIGFSGLGVDDVAEQYKTATAGADVLYSYATGGVSIIASAEIGDEQSYGLAAAYEARGLNFGIGFVEDTDAGNSAVSVTAGYTMGPVAVTGLYSDWSVGSQGYGLDVSVDTGGATFTAAWAQANGTAADVDDGVGDAYGLGVSVPLGGGLTISGGLGVIETDAVADGSRTVADIGVTMNF